MADDVDDVIREYNVEGIDPKMMDGVLEVPATSKPAEDSVEDVVGDSSIDGIDPKMLDGVLEEPVMVNYSGDPADVSVTPPVPAPAPNVTQLAAQVDMNVPDSSEMRKALANPTINDKLVEVIRKDDSTITMLNTIMEEIAEEAAYLKAWRNAVWDGKEDISEATLSRIKMLSELVKTLNEREKLKKDKAVGKIDFHSENFQSVLKFFMATIMGTFRKVQIPQQFEDIFVAQLAKDFDGFEKKAEKIYYGKSSGK
jgi:hypothetical protein